MKYFIRIFVFIMFGLAILLSVSSITQAELSAPKASSDIGYWQCYDDGSVDPCHNDITAVKMISDTDAWAVGNGGLILHWDGLEWKKYRSPSNSQINDIDMLSSTNGWAVGSEGLILHWDGIEWKIVDGPTSDTLYAIDMLTNTDGWAVGENGVAIKWNGVSWTQITTSITDWLGGVDVVSTDNVWIVGGQIILNWNGSTWNSYNTPDSSDYLIDIDMVSSNEGWAVGAYYTFFRWDGDKWTKLTPAYPSNGIIQDVSMNSSTDGWAVGDFGAIFHWNGSNWVPITGLSSEEPTLKSVQVLGTEGWIVGGGSSILRYNGSNWTDYNAPFRYTIFDVGLSSENDGWAVGVFGTIFYWDGVTWDIVDSPTFENLRSISVVSEDNAWAVGGKTILHWNGLNWEQVENEPNLPYQAIYADESNVWLAGGYAICNPTCYDVNGFISHWDGVNWSTEYVEHRSLNSIKMVNGDSGWAGGEIWSSSLPYPNLLSWNGSIWSDVNTSMINLYDITAIDEINAWAIGYNSLYEYIGYKWDGNNWVENPFPVSIWPRTIDIVNPNNVWAAGYGPIVNWNGSGWTLMTNPVSQWLYSIDMVSEDKGWIVGSNGVILEYISPTLTINYSDGTVGSFFNVVGANYPPLETASIYVNDQLIDTIQVESDGTFFFTLSTANADEGFYNVVVSVNPTASTSFLLDNDSILRTKIGDYPTFEVPDGLALKQIYLPLLNK